MVPRTIAAISGLLLALLASRAEAQESRFVTNRPAPKLLPLPREEGVFSFVIFGDRTTGKPEGLRILEQAVADVNLLAPDLVMTVGDLVQGYNDTAEWTKQALEYKAVMSGLRMPWFPVSGNHDIYWRGEGRPKNEHEGNFEKHFGPLWYAVVHKNCWFVVLHSDEGDPETGKRDFDVPSAQRMSPGQFSWLSDTLGKAKGADHVFVFLHHPRWLEGGYGDDWRRVHALLRGAGNVSAVFAGHIHRMRWDGVRDGIEYFTLAGTGATLPGDVPAAGFLHEFHVVTVRKGRLDVAAIPVGAVMDPRKVTGEVSDHVLALTERFAPRTTRRIEIDAGFGADGTCEFEIANPVPRPIELLVLLDTADPAFELGPDHQHVVLPGGAKRTVAFSVRRPAAPLDRRFTGVDLVVKCDYLGEALRITLPEKRFRVGITPPAGPEETDGAAEGALALDGETSCLRVEDGALALPDGPITVEAWLNATDLSGRRALVTKTESSEFGIFVSDGKPGFSIFVGDAYVNAVGAPHALAPGRWHHVAGEFDGSEARLYVDGALAAATRGAGARRRNRHALFVGADPDGSGKPTSFFAGQVDEVRISKVARYRGASFTPELRFRADPETVLLLHLDRELGPWVPDASAARTTVDRLGKAACVPGRR
jgi:hypothetical protein